MVKTIALSMLLLIFGMCAVYADGGHIPFEPQVQVFEPKQRAMIAWNGEEEILLLTVDLFTSKPTKVLEVVPFPAEPKVKKGDADVFVKAVNLINSKLRPGGYGFAEARVAQTGIKEAPPKPAGEVTFYEKIGSHDISVTHVLDTGGFIEWVEKYLRSKGVDNPSIPERVKSAVGEYLKDGFGWFVFDVVELDNKPKTKEAIQYTFASNYLFYPMRITQSVEGQTSIELLILSPRLLDKFDGLSRLMIRLMHEPVAITSRELRELNEDMDNLLGHKEDTRLRIWQLEGQPNSFKKDILATWTQ